MEPSPLIRLIAYNLSGGHESQALAEVLRGLRPDLVCVSEAPGRMALRRLAKRANLEVVSRGGKRGWAAAILAGQAVHVLSRGTVDLPAPDGVPDRVAAQAIVGSGGLRMAVVATQLGLRPEVRQDHAERLERALADIDAPAVIAGDFNETPSGAVATRFAEVLADAFAVAGEGRGETYPNPDPVARRDLVFVDRSLAVVRCWVPSVSPIGVASHHRPVVVEIAAPDEVPRRSETDAA